MPLNQGRFNKYVRSNAWQVLASAGPEETAADSASWANVRKHSPFAQTLIDALEGKADIKTRLNRGKSRGDGIITATEIYVYVKNEVDRLLGGVRPQHPGLFPMDQHQSGEFIFINPRVPPNSLDELPPDPNINPYQGLQPYSFADSGRFFGRDKVVGDILKQLEETDILFVTGPSGFGKSSLVKAGVYARLVGFDEWHVVRPSDLTVDKHNRVEETEEDSAEDDAPIKYVLLFDQYEEIFSLPDKEAALAKVEELFEEALRNKCKVVFTLRSDFEWQVKASPLKDYWQRENIFRVPAMELDHLREAVTGPAWWAMYDFKDKDEIDDLDTGEILINEILADVVNAPGALPLLSFTMHKFFQLAKDNDRGDRLLLSDYEELRGVEGVITRGADNVYRTTEPQLLREMTDRQRIFRQVQDHSLIRHILGMNEEGGSHLIVASSLPEETTLSDLNLVQAIKLEMDNWLNEVEKAFIKESWQRRVKRIKELVDALNEAQAGELAAKANSSRNRKTALRLAEFSEAMVNGNLSAKEELIRFYHLSKEPPHYSLDVLDSFEVGLAFSDDGMLFAAGGAGNSICLFDPEKGSMVATLSGHSGSINDLCFWPNRRTRIVSAANDNTVKIWEKSSGKWREKLSLPRHAGKVRSVAVSPDGHYIVSGDHMGNIILWAADQLSGSGVVSRLQTIQPSTHPSNADITALAFSPNSSRIVTGNRNGEVSTWKIENDQLIQEVSFSEHDQAEEIYDAWFVDNDTVISGAWDRSVWRWTIGDGTTTNHEELAREGTDYHIRYSALSPNQEYLVLAHKILCLHKFYPTSKRKGGVLRELDIDGKAARRIVFSKNSCHMAAAIDRSIKIWNLEYVNENPPLSAAEQDILERGHHFLTERQHRNLAYSADESFRIEANPDTSNITLFDIANGTEKSFRSMTVINDTVIF